MTKDKIATAVITLHIFRNPICEYLKPQSSILMRDKPLKTQSCSISTYWVVFHCLTGTSTLTHPANTAPCADLTQRLFTV